LLVQIGYYFALDQMKLFVALSLALLGLVAGFAPVSTTHLSASRCHSHKPLSALLPAWLDDHAITTSFKVPSVAGLATGLITFTSVAFAGEEMEMAELPPPWVPAAFAVVLLLGIGVLTGSLGNVIDEGAFVPTLARIECCT
jgi:hypothetical protein